MTTIQTNQIQQFAELVTAGIEAWAKAGELVVEMLDADPCAIDRICEGCDWITPEVVYRFEQIGRKQLNPKLLLSDAPGIRKLRTLPFSAQEKYANEPVELLVTSDGKTDVLKVQVKNLTPNQATQVFAKEGVRDIAKQRAYLFEKEQSATYPDLTSKMPYRIKGDVVQFRENCALTAHQLAEILTQLR